MPNRAPLGLLQKWMVLQYWIHQTPRLTNSQLRVLAKLLDRQNIKTGQCDPSGECLTGDTGMCIRAVRGAITQLENRGALKRKGKSKRASNKYLIFSVEELKQNRRISARKVRQSFGSTLHPVAENPETVCSESVQPTAPKTIKKTIKKKGRAKKKENGTVPSPDRKSKAEPIEINFMEFEHRVVKAFNKAGPGYVGLLTIPCEEIEAIHQRLQVGEITFGQAVCELLNKVSEE